GEILRADSGAKRFNAVVGLEELVMGDLALLRTEFGRFDRQISGYSLEHLLPENQRNLAATLAGTESTAGIMLETTVRAVPKAAAPAQVVCGYPKIAAADDDVNILHPHKPLAEEGLDAQLVEVERRVKCRAATPELTDGGGWSMIEVGGDDDATAL